MGRLIANLLVGVGSILDLMPPEPEPFDFRVRTADEAIRDAWHRVGVSLWEAMDVVDEAIGRDVTDVAAEQTTADVLIDSR